MSEYLVRGSSIKSKFDFVKRKFGADAAGELERAFADRKGLFPLLDSSQYPFALYDEINRHIADRFFGGDLAGLQEAGIHSADAVLSTIYQAYLSGRDFPGFLENAATLHQRFYSHGTMRFERGADGRSGTVFVENAPFYSEADLHVAAGFYRGAARKLGISHVDVQLHIAADHARFDLRWR